MSCVWLRWLSFPAHSQNLRALFEPGVVAITTSLEPITEDAVDQRTKLDLLLTQVSREDAINEVSVDLFRIARAERAGLLRMNLSTKPSPTCAPGEVSLRRI